LKRAPYVQNKWAGTKTKPNPQTKPGLLKKQWQQQKQQPNTRDSSSNPRDHFTCAFDDADVAKALKKSGNKKWVLQVLQSGYQNEWVLFFFYLAKHKQKQFNTLTSYNIEN
jgi:hypothetical protein